MSIETMTFQAGFSGDSTGRRMRSAAMRSGLSIMEVLFAIGVLTIGLMGVAFILPVATNNASDALRNDRTAEEINNRVAADLTRMTSYLTHLTAAENSAQTPPYYGITPTVTFPRSTDAGFNLTGLRFFDVPVNEEPPRFPMPPPISPLINQPSRLPDAFCIDPWFLASANNLRFTDSGTGTLANLNGYDRTLFPCYDRHFVPTISPSNVITDSLAVTWTWSTIPASRTVVWNTPRFVRMSLPGLGVDSAPLHAAARSNASSGDDLSVNVAEDTSRGAGLFVTRSANPMRSLREPTVSGRFSSMVMMSRTNPDSSLYNAAVVTFQDRKLVTVPRAGVLGNGDDLKHQLRPYAAAGPGVANPTEDQLTYPGEVMGYVTYAPRPFVGGGGGEFIFRTSSATQPQLVPGGWLCLMRQEYTADPVNPVPGFPNGRNEMVSPSGRQPVFDSRPQAPLHYAWYRISDVVTGPTLDATGTFFQTQVSVRGPDWVFHPSQVPLGGTFMQPYFATTVNGPIVAPAGTPPEYDFSVTGHPDFGTIVVSMPDVVSVRQFPIQFE